MSKKLTPQEITPIPSNMMYNSTFAFGLEGWTVAGGTAVSLGNEPTMADSPMVKIGGSVGTHSITQKVSVYGSQRFCISTYIFSHPSSRGRMSITYLKSDGVSACVGTAMKNVWIQTVNSNGFERVSFSEVTPPDCAYVTIGLSADTTTATDFSYYKNCKFEKSDYPSMWTCETDLSYLKKQTYYPTLVNGMTGKLLVTTYGSTANITGLITSGNISAMTQIAMLPFNIDSADFVPIQYSLSSGIRDTTNHALVLYKNGGLFVSGKPTSEITFNCTVNILPK